MTDPTVATAAGAVAAMIALAIMAYGFAGKPPTVLDTRIQQGILRATWRARRTVGLIMSGPGYPWFYFPVTAVFIGWLRYRHAGGTIAMVIASVAGWAIHRIIKLFAKRRRPNSMTGRSNELEAFPSGHTSATTAIALTAAYVLARQQLVPFSAALAIAIGIPLIVGAGRVISDEHWATDVIGGWIGGAGVFALAVIVFERA